MEEAKNLVDQLAAADDQDLISFLSGVPRPVFAPFITSFNCACREKDLSLDDFQAELLSLRLSLMHKTTQPLINTMHKGKPPFISRKPKPRMMTSKPQLPQSSYNPDKGTQFPPTSGTNDRSCTSLDGLANETNVQLASDRCNKLQMHLCIPKATLKATVLTYSLVIRRGGHL
ncbi:hypothetical protein DKX38_003668 [Salix brachista]|uniref:Uncharacterized protein n=1 Tax=Salix brachista TaxID=2182728 RepID=A0A5N5NQK6_9ROSI|nr:hypothetical protein DKX38_003668 [Salix brachista]